MAGSARLTIERTDARGVVVRVPLPVRRIVSLVPSTTETLFDLGRGDAVVGVTRFCCHPEARTRHLPKIGGTKDADPDRILALEPDLVVANCEENTREIFDALEGRVPLWAAFPKDVEEAIRDLRALGALIGAEAPAEERARAIEHERQALRSEAASFAFTYLIWRDPWMAVGDDTFIASVLREAGGTNECLGTDRFPVVSSGELATRGGRVLLSSEPFPFRERHVQELVDAGVARERIAFVDGELVSWHGTRLAAGLPYVRSQARSWGATSAASGD